MTEEVKVSKKYKRFIICSECGEYKPHEAKGYCKKCYDRIRERKYNKFGNKKYRTKMGKYYMIYKPHFKYSNQYTGYVKEHRYIYHIYLSIKYNRIVYLPTKKYEIHHINGNQKDNRIENLELITKPEHTKITNLNKHIIDKSKRFCNLCKSKTTRKILTNGKYYDGWNYDIDGHLCFDCYFMIKYYREKFTRKSKYKCMLIQPTTNEQTTKSRTTNTTTGRDIPRIDPKI